MVPFHPEKPFDLPSLPPKGNFDEPKFYKAIGRARTELGELKGYAASLPNPMLLLSPAIIRESVASSSIENINTTVEMALQQSLFAESERSQIDKEVLRYRNAIELGFREMVNLPISTRLIEIIHKELLPNQAVGFRKTQNQLINSASGKPTYTPPSAEKLPTLMSDLEKFIHADDDFDPLLKCGMIHYQFEAIHPFLDGNGRTGRILIVLYLIHSKILSIPILYISGYINQNKAKYYELLQGVSANDNWGDYLLFILDALYSQAKETKNTLFRVMDLYNDFKTKILETKLPSAIVDAMFASPILSPVSLAQRLGIHYTTATRYLQQLKESGDLTDIHSGKYHLFANYRLMNILRE